MISFSYKIHEKQNNLDVKKKKKKKIKVITFISVNAKIFMR